MARRPSMSGLIDKTQIKILQSIIDRIDKLYSESILELMKLLQQWKQSGTPNRKPNTSIQSTIQEIAEKETSALLDKVNNGGVLDSKEAVKLQKLSNVAKDVMAIEQADRELTDVDDEMRIKALSEVIKKNPVLAAEAMKLLNEGTDE